MAKFPTHPISPVSPNEADATRGKLLAAAAQVFAEQGFQSATVRQIVARAGANVALINYYFRDKLSLYGEVLRRTIGATEYQALQRAVAEAPDPEEALRRFIAIMLQRMSDAGQGALHLRIMAHEMARPTPALPEVVEEMIRPNHDLLCSLIGRVLGLPPDHDTTRLCAHSVIGQVLHYVHARPAIQLLWPALELTPERLDQIATHIATFTLCSLHAMAEDSRKRT